jgi:hypothetical protein
MSIGKPLPHRLDVDQSETWALDLQEVIDFKRAAGTAIRSRTGDAVAGVVELADGRKKRTPETLR